MKQDEKSSNLNAEKSASPDENLPLLDSHIIEKPIEQEMKTSYLDYAMSVIIGRALPDIRDGLKPVHRRILYAMYDMGMLHNKPFKKSARIVGETLGKYHPHGDSAVYESLVRMAQDFSLRYLLIDGQGNFGSIDGDSAAAMRYCVAGNSLIITDNGLVRIDEISKQEDIGIRVLSKDKKINTASKWFDSGEHPTLKITTHKGYSLTGTYNHPVLVLTTNEIGKPIFEWKLLEQIQEGEYVVIDRSTDKFWPEERKKLVLYYPQILKTTKVKTLPGYLNEDLAYILGSFISEGTLNADHKIEFCNTDSNWINALATVWNKVFPETKLHLFKRKPSSYGKKEYYRLECHGRYTIEFLRNIGLTAAKSATRTVPKLIFQSPKEVVASFMRAYFEGDGSISYAKRMIELSCCSKSEGLMAELQILLLRFGIDSFKRYDKYKQIWKLYLRGKRNILRFYKEIGFLSDYKTKRLEYVLHNYKKEYSNTDYVPFISDFIRSRVHNEFTEKHNFDRYGTMEQKYEKISQILVQKTNIDHSSLFEYFLTYNYLFDKVITKQEAGIQKVFSLRVDSDCHSFITNGIISHNTESRMTKLGEELLQDLDKETVAFVDNFDGSLKEPSVLPGKFPNLLINGSSGIAVGMATNIPPHNLGEISEGIIKTIDNPDVSIMELMNSIRGPDFPTGGLILGKAGLVSAYNTGKGKIKVRARTSVETKKEREAIIVHEIPYMVNKSTLITEIAEFVKDKVIEGISDLRDESDKSGLRIYIELKKGTSADVVLNQLFKHTKLQVTFGINFLAIVDNRPRTLSLKEMIGEFIKHRKDVVTKRTQYDLRKAEERVHILEGLRIALDNIDAAIQLIKSSKETKVARDKLMERYALTEIQATAILDMKLQRLTALEQDKIRLELKDLLTKIIDYKDILAHEIRVLTIIKNELLELKGTYNDERRTEITNIDDENLEIEDFIEEQECVVTITHAGYVKRLPVDTYKSQGRGGKGIVGTTTKDEDVVEHLFIANTHDYLLVFTNDGTVHWMKVFKIPEGSRQARGKAIVNLLAIDEKTKITSCIPIKEFVADKYLVMVTEKGIVKKTSLEAYSHPRQGGIRAITLDEGDSLVNVLLTDGQSQLLIATRDGQAVKFHEEDARAIGRTSRGVRGITLKGDDAVIGAVIAKNEKTLLTVTENGYGKRTPVSEYRLINRGGSGVINIQCSERNGRVIAVDEVNDEDELMFISKNGIIIRTRAKDISSIGRNTQGVRLMRLDADDKIVATAKIVNEDNPEEMKFTYKPK